MDMALLNAAAIPTVAFGPSGEGAHADVEWSTSPQSKPACGYTCARRNSCAAALAHGEAVEREGAAAVGGADPFSKKQPPPNENPIVFTLEAASAKPAGSTRPP